ncbi:protein STICHEL [Cicer arietinum]|uniref:Protein STICHEL n=1 Tax=Cicer arietinum TaxID=3827 RepID=A0A1S2Y4R4_CICAR|nr:protein STICHEL [Cicer arietinum]XP_004499357.1 protein STICHEL [Cicer arietinum]
MSDPRRLHLKKELTQIRKASRVLRDPGTTSSWKSSRSTTLFRDPNNNSFSANNNNNNNNINNENNNKVFLYNWKNNYNSFNQEEEEEEEEEEDSSSYSLLASLEDNGFDSKSDAGTRPSFFLNHNNKKKKKCNKNTNPHFDFLTNHTKLLTPNSNKLLHRHSPFTKDDSDCYSNSVSGASPILLRKLKHTNQSRSSSNFIRTSPKDDSSYSYSTPALSTSSYNRTYARRRRHYPSTVGSYDGTTTSVNDGDDEIDDRLDLPGRQGCGIPCYWSKRSCCSPSLSDTLRRKGSSILCGTQSMYSRHRRSCSASHKRRMPLRSARGGGGGGVVPLLTSTSSGDVRQGSSIGIGRSDYEDDDVSTNFGELDLEGLSKLDGRRWSSSCRSQEGMEIVLINAEGEEDEEGSSENGRSFIHKYKPLFFGELIGQNIVVHSLINAVSRGRIAPVYLFQGPRGTGKTSTARIFAAALNCVTSDESKPCGYCRECADFVSGKSSDMMEVDGTNKKGIDKARYLLKRLSVGSSSAASSRYTVFVIDECHLLPSKTWLGFLKFLEEPPQRVVFIFITSDVDNVPRTIQSRCQKYVFNKIKDGDIVTRLRKISTQENLDVETDALDLIAMNADGSLRDAETMLEQLSLLGKRITSSLVNELVGVVSDEKLLELLELAMSADTAETVKRSRELMDSGVDPMVLMSQLAGLIMDIIAGSYTVVDTKPDGSSFGGRNLNETELERLKNALRLLSEAEKQLRTSSERSTWFTATLLQLGSVPSSDLTQSSSSRRQSCKTTEDDPSSTSRDITSFKHKSDLQYTPHNSTSPASHQKAVNGISGLQMDTSSLKSKPSNSPVINDGSTVVSSDDLIVGNAMFRCIDSGKLCDIWACCIEKCHSKTLRQLLHNHGKLVSISEVQGVLVAYVAFGDGDIKLRVERFLRSITNSLEIVLRRNVEVRIILLPEDEGENQVNLPGLKQAASTGASEEEHRLGHVNGTESFSSLPVLMNGGSLDIVAEGNGVRERRRDNPVQRIESIIREQRLETAWLQAVEKGSPGSLSRLRPEKNQVLPQDGAYCVNPMESMDSTRFSSHQHRDDDANSDLKILALKNGRDPLKDQVGKRAECYPMPPSLLHDSSLAIIAGKDNMGYESGSGARGCGFLCWNNNNSKTRRAVKVKGTPVGARKARRFTLFGECGKKPKKKECKR